MEFEHLQVVKNPLILNKSFDIDELRKNLKIEVIAMDDEHLEFDMVGVDVSIANALRRIILSDIPSIAIEKVHMMNNTSIVPDEVIAHRLGMVPIDVDPSLMDFVDKSVKMDQSEELPETQVLIFELKCKCVQNSDGSLRDNIVTSGMLEWIPIGNQMEMFGDKPPKPLHDDITLVKLNPNQELDMRLLCVKGVGRDHAKFSPVSNVSYRLYPEITLKQKIYGDDALLLKNYFSPGVVELVSHPKYGVRAKIVNSRIDSNSRNVKHDEKLKDLVTLSRRPNHFIFTVESIGVYSPQKLIMDAIDYLWKKAQTYVDELSLEIQ